MKLHLPGRHHDPDVHAEPGKPHAFVVIHDPGLGAMAASGPSREAVGGVPAGLAVAHGSLRASVCGLPGCGRDRGDEIHAAPEQ